MNLGISNLKNISYNKIESKHKIENKETSEVENRPNNKDNLDIKTNQKKSSAISKIDINIEDNFNKSFQELNNNQKKIYLEVSKNISIEDKKKLDNLLVDKTLLIKDCEGTSILENLLSIKNLKNINGNKLFSETLKMLQKSDIKEIIKLSENTKQSNINNGINRSIDKKNGIYQEGISPKGGIKEITQSTSRYTCGAASMQVYFQNEKPEFLVKLIKDLASGKNSKFEKISFKNPPESLELASGKISDSKEDRSSIDIIIQSALMNEINLSGSKFLGFDQKYDVLKDHDIDSDFENAINKLNGNGGANPKRIANKMTDITGEKFDYIHSINITKTNGLLEKIFNLDKSPKNNQNLLNELDKQVLKGNKVIVAYNTNPNDPLGLHYVTILGKNSKSEYCFIDTDQEKKTGSIIFSMNKEEMLKKIRIVIYKSDSI